MEREHFKEDWEKAGEKLHLYSPASIATSLIPDESKDFLQSVGLPVEAAPWLNFGDYEGNWIPTEVLSKPYFPVGSNGGGDPIVISDDGSVFYLDHDRAFVPIYINKSVEVLAEALLRFRNLVTESQRLGGPDAFLDGQVPPRLRGDFLGFLTEIDPRSVQTSSMWSAEMKILL